MTESSGYMDPGSYDAATYAAAQDRIVKTGYQQGFLNNLEVYQHTAPDMSVNVATGGCWIKGNWYLNSAVENLAIDAADAVLDRIDLIVARRSGTTSIVLAVLKGTAAGSPSAPTLTTTLVTYEIALAQISIVHETTAITTAMITDKRLSTDCGPVACEMGYFTIDPATGNLLGGTKQIKTIADPSAAQDAATKASSEAYTDAQCGLISGASSSFKRYVRVASTAALTKATAVENGDTIDGITLVTGDRVLLKNQAAPAENGIWIVAASGAPTRATDYDSSVDILGSTIPVLLGTVNANTIWQCTNASTITVDATSLTFQILRPSPMALVPVSVAGAVLGASFSTSADAVGVSKDLLSLNIRRAGGYTVKLAVCVNRSAAIYLYINGGYVATVDTLTAYTEKSFGDVSLSVGDRVSVMFISSGGESGQAVTLNFYNADGVW